MAASRRRIAELAIAIQLTFASRTARLRTLLTGLGVAFGVVVLVAAASVPHAIARRQQREYAAAPVFGGDHGRLRLFAESTSFAGATIAEDDVQVSPGTGAVPRPPGVTRLPGPGRMVVSPAVARLLRGPGGAQLRRRLRARVVGTIAPAGLPDPDSAVLYRGSRELVAEGQASVDRFGGGPAGAPQTPLVTLIVITIVVALLLPVAVFVATAARFGAEERDGRLAAMRLVGADVAATARIAAGESLLAALAGLVLGALAFLALAPALAGAGLGGLDAFASDLRPAPGLAVLVAVLVPLSAVAATLVSIRRVAVEPLGLAVRAGRRRRRIAWRLVVPALGFALLAPLVGDVSRLSSGLGQIQATGGVILVLVGVTALLPWLVEAIVRHAPDGPLPWLLAIRRLRHDEGSTGRVIGAIGLAVAGAVALSVVFGAAQRHVSAEARAGADQVDVEFAAPTRAAARADIAGIRRLPGLTSPGPIAIGGLGRWFQAEDTFTLRDGGPALLGRLQDAAAARDPDAQVETSSADGADVRVFGDLRRGLVGGAILVLGVIGASLLVAAGEGLRERRPALAVLGAVGTRRSTVAWSLLWQTAIPVTGGLALAVVLGLALGAMLTAVAGLGLVADWAGIGLMLAAGAGVIAVVTGLTLPTLGRAMRPEALRVE